MNIKSVVKLNRRALSIVISAALLMAVLGHSGTEGVLHGLLNFPLWAVALITVIYSVNLSLVSFRLWRMLAHFGIAVPWAIASRASVSGHMAGLFVTSLFGQTLGRQSVLRHYGVRSVVVAALTAYERAILLIVSGVIAAMSAFFLLGHAVISTFLDRIPIVEILIAATVGSLLSLTLGSSHFEARLAKNFRSRFIYKCFAEITALTVLGQFVVLLSFVVGVMAIAPAIPFWPVFAAAAVIGFAASVPITVSGWGLREIASVYVLGKLGVSSADAISVSVMAGLCMTFVILTATLFSLRNPKTTKFMTEIVPANNPSVVEIEKNSAWVLAMSVGVLVFFQMHFDLSGSGSVINLNLADPFAILALAAAAVHLVFTRQLPVWRVKHFNAILAAITLVLFFGVVHGVLKIGMTQWALGGRAIGWFVLLGYVFAGHMMAAYAGGHGLRRLMETMISTGVVVTLLQVFLRIFDRAGLDIGIELTQNFEGYAANRNAFAFQLMICTILVLAYSSVQLKAGTSTCVKHINKAKAFDIARTQSYAILLGVLLMGLWLSNSRAGLIAITVLLLFAWFGRMADRRVLAYGLLCAGLITLATVLVDQLAFSTLSFFGAAKSHVFGAAKSHVLLQSSLSYETSNQERIETIARGLEMWRDAPIFGSGVGVFAKNSVDWIGHSSVIHSTPVWILAELGITGAAVFLWAFVVLVKGALKMGYKRPARRMILLVLLGFAVFSLVHEMLFQRIFWLVLGAALGLPDKKVT